MLAAIVSFLGSAVAFIAAALKIFGPKAPPVVVQEAEKAASEGVSLSVDTQAVKIAEAVSDAVVKAPKTQSDAVQAFKAGDV